MKSAKDSNNNLYTNSPGHVPVEVQQMAVLDTSVMYGSNAGIIWTAIQCWKVQVDEATRGKLLRIYSVNFSIPFCAWFPLSFLKNHQFVTRFSYLCLLSKQIVFHGIPRVRVIISGQAKLEMVKVNPRRFSYQTSSINRVINCWIYISEPQPSICKISCNTSCNVECSTNYNIFYSLVIVLSG